MLIQIAVAASVASMTPAQLESYYWDCDTAFMKQQLSGQDLNSCLSITQQFLETVFENNKDKFWLYWDNTRQTEWVKRGYWPK